MRALRSTLIVVEDSLISKLVRSVLQKQGYTAVLANAPQAKELLRSPASAGTILVTNSPGLFLEFSETTPLLYLTSLPDAGLQAAFKQCRIVRKPFAPSDLLDAAGALAAGDTG